MTRRLTVPILVLASLAFCLAELTAAGAKPRDRDHDRLPDTWEKRYHLSTKHRSTKRDPDHDRLKNLREHRAHTNPRRADTDGDHLRDGAELRRFHTNPRKRDTDGDGLSDWREIRRLHTNPRNRDTDGDGISDGTEVRRGTNPRNASDPPPPGTSPPLPPLRACVATPNTPDGPDPWGGCWPGPATTGVPDTTPLTNYTGPCTITTAGTVIDSKTTSCGLSIRAANVTIRNSRVNGSVTVTNPGSLAITDTTIDAGPVNSTVNDGPRAINGVNFVANRIETVRGISGGFCESNCTIQDSWIHGQDRDEGGHAHASGMRMQTGTTLRHNTLICDAPTVPPDAGCSADLTGYGDFAPTRDNLIERNLFLATPGGTCAYGGSSAGKPYSGDVANIVFRENIFQRRNEFQSSGKCGTYGPILDFSLSEPGNQWVGNRWDDGAAVQPTN